MRLANAHLVENQSLATRKQTAFQSPPLPPLSWGDFFCKPARRSISIMAQSPWLFPPLTTVPPKLMCFSELWMQGGPSVTGGSLSSISPQGLKEITCAPHLLANKHVLDMLVSALFSAEKH